LICPIYHFAYKIQQNFTIYNNVKRLDITPNYTNFSMVWHEIFPTRKHVKLHRFCEKWCVVLHNLDTVDCSTILYSKQTRAGWPDCTRWILSNIYNILQNPLPNYK